MANTAQHDGGTRLSRGSEALARLHDLGVDVADLEAALDSGELAAGTPDEAHPTTASGAYRWYETVAMLRRRLAAKGGASRGVVGFGEALERVVEREGVTV